VTIGLRGVAQVLLIALIALVLAGCSQATSVPEDVAAEETPVATATAIAATPTPQQTATPEARGVGGDRDLIRLAQESVVRIETDFGGGTGFVVDNLEGNLVVITNAHVIEHASEVHVLDGDDERWPAVGFYLDPIADLAILEVPSLQVPLLELSDDPVDVTDDIWVIGFPLLLEGDPTITRGVISSKRQHDNVSHLQIDAAINPGNSGGPVLNEKGQVVAVATARYLGDSETAVEGMGLALPTSRIFSLLHSAATQTAKQFSDREASSQEQPAASDQPSPPESNVENNAMELLGNLPGSASAILLLPDGSIAEQSSGRSVPAGSLIKLWIAAAVLEEWYLGNLDLQATHRITEADQAPGTGVLNSPEFLGHAATYEELVFLMLMASDNSAANILIDRVGGFDRVNRYASNSGYPSTRIQRYLGYLDPSSDNYTSAADSALFMMDLLDGRIVSNEASNLLFDLLVTRREFDSERLDYFGRNLPSGALYGHISGLTPQTRNEVGFILTESGQLIVIALLLQDLSDESAGERAILNTVEEIYYLVEQ
jgi:S1-C subfamily serine protease